MHLVAPHAEDDLARSRTRPLRIGTNAFFQDEVPFQAEIRAVSTAPSSATRSLPDEGFIAAWSSKRR